MTGSATYSVHDSASAVRDGTGPRATRTLPATGSVLASEATYGQVSKLFDSGHFCGASEWQHDECDQTKNGQLMSANPEVIPKSAIATQHATAARTVPEYHWRRSASVDGARENR